MISLYEIKDNVNKVKEKEIAKIKENAQDEIHLIEEGITAESLLGNSNFMIYITNFKGELTEKEWKMKKKYLFEYFSEKGFDVSIGSCNSFLMEEKTWLRIEWSEY